MKKARTSRRVGIFGGTFDPPHNGHFEIARRAKHQLGLSTVVFVPARIPPHKQNRVTTSPKDRLRMLRLLIKGENGFTISTIELRRRGISYTVDTLKEFRRKYPKAALTLIIGSDNLAQLHAWKSPKTILQVASIAVYARMGFRKGRTMSVADAVWLNGPLMAISSTEIRRRIAKGLPINRFVLRPIRDYIKRHRLYRNGSE